MIKIEKNVPIPNKRGSGRKAKYPFSEMQIGDSFFTDNILPRALYQAAKLWNKRSGKDYRWKAYKEGEFGARIWRIN